MGRGRKCRVGLGSQGGLAAELSEVINRVRRAFGQIPMADFAGRPEIVEAAQRVNLVARKRVQGEAAAGAWQQALAHYEACWMQQLGASRSSRAA